MSKDQQSGVPAGVTPLGDGLRAWSPPRVTRLRAGEAENSPTGVTADAHFSSGS